VEVLVRKLLVSLFFAVSYSSAQNAPALAKQAAMESDLIGKIDGMKKQAQVMVDSVFSYGELGFQEFETSKYLTGLLEKEGFKVEKGVAGIPTAFVATWGQGKPVIAYVPAVESDSAEKLLVELRGTYPELDEKELLINQLQLFSSNESLEDLQTSNVKFLLIPAFLGNLTGKLMSEQRLEIVNLARIYYRDFIQRLQSYKLISVLLEPDDDEDEKEKRRYFHCSVTWRRSRMLPSSREIWARAML